MMLLSSPIFAGFPLKKLRHAVRFHVLQKLLLNAPSVNSVSLIRHAPVPNQVAITAEKTSKTLSLVACSVPAVRHEIAQKDTVVTDM